MNDLPQCGPLQVGGIDHDGVVTTECGSGNNDVGGSCGFEVCGSKYITCISTAFHCSQRLQEHKDLFIHISCSSHV